MKVVFDGRSCEAYEILSTRKSELTIVVDGMTVETDTLDAYEALNPAKGRYLLIEDDTLAPVTTLTQKQTEALFTSGSGGEGGLGSDEGVPSGEKTLGNTTASQAKENVRDIQFWGDGDMWKLISKAWSQSEGWMKSTKAMKVPGGVLVQVSTQQGENVAEALEFVPKANIVEEMDAEGKVIRRSIR